MGGIYSTAIFLLTIQTEWAEYSLRFNASIHSLSMTLKVPICQCYCHPWYLQSLRMFSFTLRKCFKQNCFPIKSASHCPYVLFFICLFYTLYICGNHEYLFFFFKHHFRCTKLCLYQLLFYITLPCKHSSIFLVLLSLDAVPFSNAEHNYLMFLTTLNGLLVAALSPRFC